MEAEQRLQKKNYEVISSSVVPTWEQIHEKSDSTELWLIQLPENVSIKDLDKQQIIVPSNSLEKESNSLCSTISTKTGQYSLHELDHQTVSNMHAVVWSTRQNQLKTTQSFQRSLSVSCSVDFPTTASNKQTTDNAIKTSNQSENEQTNVSQQDPMQESAGVNGLALGRSSIVPQLDKMTGRFYQMGTSASAKQYAQHSDANMISKTSSTDKNTFNTTSTPDKKNGHVSKKRSREASTPNTAEKTSKKRAKSEKKKKHKQTSS